MHHTAYVVYLIVHELFSLKEPRSFRATILKMHSCIHNEPGAVRLLLNLPEVDTHGSSGVCPCDNTPMQRSRNAHDEH